MGPLTGARGGVTRSLVWATDLDALGVDRMIERRDGHLLVRSPSNPGHYWGNLLLFDDPPGEGDGGRWEALFAREFAGEPRVAHRTFAWDRLDGAIGRAAQEFVALGYELVTNAGLVAAPAQIRAHARCNRAVQVRALDAQAGGGDGRLWEQVFEMEAGWRDADADEDAHRAFTRRRMETLCEQFRRGEGAWYVALDPAGEEVLASCAVVASEGRAGFQSVQTAVAHRRRGICSRLVVEAAALTAARHGTEWFVIAADPDYHALGLYESLGFRQVERVSGVCRRPLYDGAAPSGARWCRES